jgi:hypothetical protein
MQPRHEGVVLHDFLGSFLTLATLFAAVDEFPANSTPYGEVAGWCRGRGHHRAADAPELTSAQKPALPFTIPCSWEARMLATAQDSLAGGGLRS